MNPTFRSSPCARRLPQLSLTLLLLTASAAADTPADTKPLASDSATTAVQESGPTPEGLAEARLELIDIAFRAASALPVQPHVKTRSRAQASVIEVCLELDQPELAETYARDVVNWRRGEAYAELALYSAQHDAPSKARHYAELADAIARTSEDALLQDWRRERIFAGIAAAYLTLGDVEQAAAYATGLADSERGTVLATRARLSSDEELDAQLEALELAAERSEFDLLRGLLQSHLELFDRNYEDVERRSRVEAGLRAAWLSVPALIRIDQLSGLSASAASHEDTQAAADYLDDALALVEAGRWTPDVELTLRARLAGARRAAGDEERGRREADAVRTAYGERQAKIVNIERAGVVRTLAEAYCDLGDEARALQLYRQAAEEGLVNPNSRPRATDFVATCLSMARCDVEPDPDFAARLIEIFEGLGDPW